jgi:hypothetical protein
MFGLPASTFFWVIIMPLIAVVAAIIFGLTFKDSDDWWTIDDWFDKGSGK